MYIEMVKAKIETLKMKLRRKGELNLTQKAEGVRIEPILGKERQPVFGPAPSGMKASMDEH